MLSSRSWAFGRYYLPRFGQALAATLADRRPVLVHFDDPGVGLFAPIPGLLNVYAPHNVEHLIAERTAMSATGVRRRFARLEAAKLRREERRLWRETRLSVAVSETDARAMIDGGAPRVAICPNGTDEVTRLPAPWRRPDEPLRLLFVGSANYLPYERGLAWFAHEVLPRVQEATPTTLDVVGAPPRRPVKAAGVRYVGRVPSVGEWYERSHAAVVPMFEGSGTRLKIVEAMAYGRPVVSTSLGAEGLPVVAGEHYLQADDAATFIRAILELADQSTEPDGLEPLLGAARGAVTSLFWPSIAEELAGTYHLELEEHSDDKSPTV